METSYVNLFIDDCFWSDEESFQKMVLDELLSDKSEYKVDVLALLVSDSDEIQSIRTGEDFMYIPEFMDDDTTDEEFEKIPEYRKGYPCDGWSRTTDKDTFCLVVNKCPKCEVELYLSKYAASNYEVGTGWSNIFENANELLAKFIEHESLKTIKDLKNYLEKTGNKIFLED